MSSDASPAHTHFPVDPVVLRAFAGDPAAEREVCYRLLPAVRAFAQRRLRRGSAEDFVQDVLILVIEALREHRIEEPSRVAAFALGVCRNLARERARSGERRRELCARYGLTEDDLVVSDRPLKLRRERLEDCFSQLTERARRIVRSTFCDDDTDTEIALGLAVSEANVRVIRHRSLATLRSCLGGGISWVQA